MDEQFPHYSLEFEYRTRGSNFLWTSRDQISKGFPSILPFREAWKIQGPTIIEAIIELDSESVQVVFSPRKFDVNSAD